jgi:hypothetical protein
MKGTEAARINNLYNGEPMYLIGQKVEWTRRKLAELTQEWV